MAVSRSTKISILLAIDLVFFFVELIAGYTVGSLALVADSFHMLNDVMSLVVALYAIKLTQNNVASAEYSYGWHRAEILAALINGVFLLALCFSIFIEAIERFFSVPEVGNPKLVVIVGSLGLLSNFVGLFLFHDHGHSHGHDSHTPTPGSKAIIDPNASQSDLSPLLPSDSIAPLPHGLTSNSHRRSDSLSRAFNRHRSDSDSNASIGFYPAQVRASLVQVAEEMRAEGEGTTSPEPRSTPRKKPAPARLSSSAPGPNEGGSLEEVLAHARGAISPFGPREEDPIHRIEEGRAAADSRNNMFEEDDDDEEAPMASVVHAGHSHSNGGHGNGHSHAAESGSGHGHGHGHGSMNMQAVLLHVIGDALGNVGVIATGLVIWLTSWQYKYYCDPMISLIITMIIFSSALPLVKSASFILLQGVPTSVSLEEVRSAILLIPGVISVHELHIWQLSESKIVASVHVLVRKSLKGCPTPPPEVAKAARTLFVQDGPELENGEHVYMAVAADIRKVLHEFGVHSSTIQPEYAVDGGDLDAASVNSACLISCMADGDCDPANACCPPSAMTPSRTTE